MDMRMPGGSSLFATLFDTGAVADPVGTRSGAIVRDVTEAQLVEALVSMAAGSIEFVGLVDGGDFIEAAGSDDGPYALHHGTAAAAAVAGEIPNGVDRATMEAALLAYRRGDPSWRSVGEWRAPMSGAERRVEVKRARTVARAQRVAARDSRSSEGRPSGWLARVLRR